jgi:hypothetical protein
MWGGAGQCRERPAAAQQLLTDIFANVTVMDKSANDSIKNFQVGNGDGDHPRVRGARRPEPAEDEMVIRRRCDETPVTVIDANAHGIRRVELQRRS